jgi:hypothetical protein
MMNSTMVVRVLSISLALVFLGMVAPGLSRASLSTDSGLDFEVAIDSELEKSLAIMNENQDITIRLFFRLEWVDTCGLSFDESLQGMEILPGQTEYVKLKFKPSDLGLCSNNLIVLYMGLGAPLYGNIVVGLSGMGIEAKPSTVMIDGQDTGVENRLHEEQTISERLEKCSENAKNHGQYVRCVALVARKMRKAEVLTKEEGQTIVKAAAHANIPPRKSGIEDLEYNGELVTDLIKECKENAENKRQYVRRVYELMKELEKDGVIETKKEKRQILKYAKRLKFHGRHHK